jgi:hypothetical protein
MEAYLLSTASAFRKPMSMLTGLPRTQRSCLHAMLWLVLLGAGPRPLVHSHAVFDDHAWGEQGLVWHLASYHADSDSRLGGNTDVHLHWVLPTCSDVGMIQYPTVIETPAAIAGWSLSQDPFGWHGTMALSGVADVGLHGSGPPPGWRLLVHGRLPARSLPAYTLFCCMHC